MVRGRSAHAVPAGAKRRDSVIRGSTARRADGWRLQPTTLVTCATTLRMRRSITRTRAGAEWALKSDAKTSTGAASIRTPICPNPQRQNEPHADAAARGRGRGVAL
jgi:hypothetical protein